MHIFYTPDIKGDKYTLTEDESKHCIKVLRLSLNDTVFLIDGKGGLCKARIIDNHHKRCTVEVFEKQHDNKKRNYYLHIGIAPTKNIARFEWFLEKATEIGIDEITPFVGFHSERKTIKPPRLQKIIVSALKQSLQTYCPKLNEIVSFTDFMQKAGHFSGDKFIAHCAENGKKTQLKDACKSKQKVLILIGPEGDFSKDEIVMARKSGFQEISLGNTRLRTETAGIVACHTLALQNQ